MSGFTLFFFNSSIVCSNCLKWPNEMSLIFARQKVILFPFKTILGIDLWLIKMDSFNVVQSNLYRKATLWNMKEEFEDTKGAIRIRILKKNRQHNGQKKKYKNNSEISLLLSFSFSSHVSFVLFFLYLGLVSQYQV